MTRQIILSSLFMFSMITGSAQTTKPGNPALVSSDAALKKLMDAAEGNYKYKVEDYFAHPKQSDFQLSPNGKYLSWKERDDSGKNHYIIKEISSGKTTRALDEKDNVIIGYGWATNDRLIYMMDSGGNENYHLYAINIDGSGDLDLTPYDGVRASILKRLPENKDILIVSMNKDNKQNFDPYKINIHTGEATKLYDNTDMKNPVFDYIFDKDGNLRGLINFYNGVDMQYHYKPVGAKDFSLLKTVSWANKFVVQSFNYASKNPDEAYVLTNLDSDKGRIVLYDLKANKVIKEIYSNPIYDVSKISLSRKRNWELDYVAYEGEKNVTRPVSSTFKNIYKNLEKEFKGYQYQVVQQTENEDQLLIKVTSDKLFGKFYHYDTKTGKTSLLFDLMPQLKEEDMAVMQPIVFKSRDGLTIHGYITLPKEAQDGQRVPVIVNPHGGPHGFRDTWGFNPEAQLFASRGYATLQINFRISDGYGLKFFKAGFKQAGRKMMDDLEDGVQYVITRGWVDKNKVGIYGGSHGGYATLMGLIKSPELYKVGVDYVGISNIFTFFSSLPAYWQPVTGMLKEIWYDLDSPVEGQIARDVSPINHYDQIKAPLFVVQGANDPRVNISESDRIVEALRNKGVDVPYMVKYDEGHGFLKEQNQIDFYKAMVGFFSQHLK